jgi:hypothetical protein
LRLVESAFNEINFCEVVFFAEMIAKEKAESEKARMIAASFTAWLSGASEGITFQKFLKSYGLMEPEPEAMPEQIAAMKKEALNKAEKILRAFKRGKKRSKK